MSLQTVAQIAQILGPTVVAVGVIIGLVQLRDLRRQRREMAAVELVNSFRSADFNRAIRLIWTLPERPSLEEFRCGGAEMETAALLIGTTLESVGVLVHRRVAPLDIVDHLMGDAIVGFWGRLGPWVMQVRREQGRESFYEWFQWLVERLAERERRTTVGAHVRYRSWRP